MLFNMNLNGNVLKIGFGDAASNDAIVREVAQSLKEMSLPGGKILKINGPASLPVAVVIAHGVTHLYGAVAVWDPKMSVYIVCVSHDPDYSIGDKVD